MRKHLPVMFVGIVSLAVFGACQTEVSAQVPTQSTKKNAESVADRIERVTKKVNQQQTYDLKYRLNEGDEIRWNFEHTVSTKFQMAGDVEESSSRSENTKLWKVLNVDKLGNMTFSFTVESVKMWTKIGEDDPISYDSKVDSEVPDMYVAAAEDVGKPLAIFSIEPTGKIIDRKSHRKQDVFGIGKVTIPLPEESIPVGHKWSVPTVLSADDQQGTKRLKARILYELAKVKDQNAYIRFRTEVLTPVTSEKIKSTIMQKLTKGIVVFDMKRGRPILQRMEWDEKAQGFEGPDSYLKFVAMMSEKMVESDGSTSQANTLGLKPIQQEVERMAVEIKTSDSEPVMRK